MTGLHRRLDLSSDSTPSNARRASLPVLVCFLYGWLPVFAQPNGIPEAGIEVAKPIEPGSVHAYRIRFHEGRQCAQAILEQRGTDLFVEFRASGGGEPLYRLDSRWHGAESLTLMAVSPGEYLLEVKRVSASGSGGAYRLKIEHARAARASDESALAAQKLATRLKELVAKGTAQSHREALAVAQQTAAAWRELGDRSGEAQARNTLGFLHNALGRSGEAMKEYEAALALWRVAGDRSGQGEALHNIAAALYALGHREKARENYQLALMHRRASGDLAGEGTTLANIANLYQAMGNRRSA